MNKALKRSEVTLIRLVEEVLQSLSNVTRKSHGAAQNSLK